MPPKYPNSKTACDTTVQYVRRTWYDTKFTPSFPTKSEKIPDTVRPIGIKGFGGIAIRRQAGGLEQGFANIAIALRGKLITWLHR